MISKTESPGHPMTDLMGVVEGVAWVGQRDANSAKARVPAPDAESEGGGFAGVQANAQAGEGVETAGSVTYLELSGV